MLILGSRALDGGLFKQHFASDEHYASGRIVWGVNDTVIGILTQIDNMVADMVRRPAQQQEPVAKVDYKQRDGFLWLNSFGWQRIPDGASLYTSPPASKPWVGLTDEEFASMWMRSEIYGTNREKAIALGRAIEAKLREKNA